MGGADSDSTDQSNVRVTGHRYGYMLEVAMLLVVSCYGGPGNLYGMLLDLGS